MINNESAMVSPASGVKNVVTVPHGERDVWTLRWLIWTYFVLLIFEGALRKWIVPQLANPLLIVRDPILLMCYVEAYRTGCVPWNRWMTAVCVLGTLCFSTTMVSWLVGVSKSTLLINTYGLRSNFLHLPLMFVMARSLKRRDVENFGKAMLLLAMPMAFLVFAQYSSEPSAWVNVGAGAREGGQIGAAVSGVEKIRPAGTFSFATGIVAFNGLLAAFVFSNILKASFPRKIFLLGLFALCALTAFSISRSALLNVVIVGACAILAAFTYPRLGLRIVGWAVCLMPLLLLIGQFAGFREASEIMSQRFEETEGVKVGIVGRFLGGFSNAFTYAADAPFFGYGLGFGTNVAAGLRTGEAGFTLAEVEWERVVLESGALLGLSYLFLRVAMAVGLLRVGLYRLRLYRDPLPLLLWSACFLRVIQGQFGQPTELGFAVFGAGLCLASARQ